jgi:hypothetical protein
VDWKQKKSSLCIRCGKEETTTHVWQCTGMESGIKWLQTIKDLEKWLKSVDTSPELLNIIISNLTAWLFNTIDTTVRSPLEQSQDAIGWEYLIEGVMPIMWSNHQTEYYKSKNKQNNGFRWLVQVIQKLWLIAWDIWKLRNASVKTARKTQESNDLNQEIDKAFNTDHPYSSRFLFKNKYQTSLKSKPIPTRRLWLATLDAHRHTRTSNKRLMQTTI